MIETDASAWPHISLQAEAIAASLDLVDHHPAQAEAWRRLRPDGRRSDGERGRRGTRRTTICSLATMPRVLIVHHSPSPSCRAMLEAVQDGASNDQIEDVDVVTRAALAATTSDVLEADAYLLGTPANIGYMSGALKHVRPRSVPPVERSASPVFELHRRWRDKPTSVTTAGIATFTLARLQAGTTSATGRSAGYRPRLRIIGRRRPGGRTRIGVPVRLGGRWFLLVYRRWRRVSGDV